MYFLIALAWIYAGLILTALILLIRDEDIDGNVMCYLGGMLAGPLVVFPLIYWVLAHFTARKELNFEEPT
jgi:hypothetical protein